MVTVKDSLSQQRYLQADLHDIRRAAERWWRLLEAHNGLGFSEPERAVKAACAVILTRVRRDALGQYHLAPLQMRLDEVDVA